MSKITYSDIPAQVFMEDTVLKKINRLIHGDAHRETGGFFIGNVSKDDISGRYTLHIHDLYFEERYGSGSSFSFNLDYSFNAYQYVKKNCNGYHIVGNFHSHAQFKAFFSAVDNEMMTQSRDNSFYMVVSPRHNNWVCCFKDSDMLFHECQLNIAAPAAESSLFNKSITCESKETLLNGKKCSSSTFRTERFYTEAQQQELDKRFLHSIKELSDKKVLIVGAGTIGNLLAEYAMNSGIGNLCIVDMDSYQYWNLPRSSMVGEDSLCKPKATELAGAVARKACFPITVTGINADICDLGWGFFSGFDVVLSPVDSAAIRQYIDRGCKLYGIPHITCGTGTIQDDFTGNVLAFPRNSAVDLEYAWGNSYRSKLNERKSCSDVKPETQPQLMGFSSQIAGITMDIALKYLLGRMQEDSVAYKYILNSLGSSFEQDKTALRAYKYSRHPAAAQSELYSMLGSREDIPKIRFDRTRPKHELWQQLNDLFGEDIPSYRLNLEWSMNFPLAYSYTNALAKLEIACNTIADETLLRLPKQHIYLVEGFEKDYLVEITFTEQA